MSKKEIPNNKIEKINFSVRKIFQNLGSRRKNKNKVNNTSENSGQFIIFITFERTDTHVQVLSLVGTFTIRVVANKATRTRKKGKKKTQTNKKERTAK